MDRSEDCCNSYLIFICNVSFISSCLQNFLFIFDFSSLSMICVGVCVCVYLSCLCFSELLRSGVLSFIYYGKLSAIISSNISSAVFFLFFSWNFNYRYVKPFDIQPQFFNALCCFVLFSVLIWIISFDLSSSLLIFS